MNDQHEDIEPEEQRYEITEDGKLVAVESSDADFEDDLRFDG
jgi:hypothetical protein